ncbi:MAG TPA: protein tyrosine phosphatase [Firmicutes bacterium]|nr:protein tyrosine phosphatase [Bacillota bacterium]
MKRRLGILSLVLVLALSFSGVVLADVAGKVAVVDKYGNVTLDLLTEELFAAGYEFGDILTVTVGTADFEAPFVTAYSDVDNDRLLVRGPGGDPTANVMVAINMGNFAGTYGVEEGDPISLALKEKEAYFAEWAIRQLTRTNEREDYSTDEVFANFRNVAIGKLAVGVYYRSSSPVNNDLGRAAYADELAEKAGIKTVINLADSEKELHSYFEQADYNSPYYRKLYENGQVILLSMGVDFKSADFQEKLKAGLEFMLANEGPYLIHCNEGKDRAGFATALLEALAGASVREIKEDYMLTYMNYFNVEYGSERYEKIAESNILESLRYIAGLTPGADLTGVDLEKAAEDYLYGIGLNENQIQSLKDVLAGEQALADAA